MHLFLPAEDSEHELRAELEQACCAPLVSRSGLLACELDLEERKPLPYLVFARQWLPFAREAKADSIRAWANLILEAVVGVLPEGQPWSFSIAPHQHRRVAPRIGARAWHTVRARLEVGNPDSALQPNPSRHPGEHRCELIRNALLELLRKKRRHLLRSLRAQPSPFTMSDSIVQVLLTTPASGFLSVTPAPVPFEQRHLLSPFPKGAIPVASDQAAPSRAFAKLVEAEQRLGRGIQRGETCVDLGAAPGGWTYVAVNRGARVLAIDRSALRGDLMSHARVSFQTGDAFRFKPRVRVDWLLCDVIAAPDRVASLLVEWLHQGWCRNFVVTLKLGEWGTTTGRDVIKRLKQELPPLTRELRLTRLCANKNEVCAFGTASRQGQSPTRDHQ